MPAVCDNVLDMIGNTPLVHLRSLSQATRCTILAKAEFSNPGGSSKDRVAAAMVQEAEASGALAPGGTLVEATSGSTGVSLALVARARGYGCLLVVPDDTSGEKLAMMHALGAEVEVVKPAPIASDDNAVNVALRRAKERPGSVFCDQVHDRRGIVGGAQVSRYAQWGAKRRMAGNLPRVLLPVRNPQP